MPPPKAPPAGASALAQILQNARATPRQEVARAGLETRFCERCGANRVEGTDLTRCQFCGGSFLESARAFCGQCGGPRPPGPGRCAHCGAQDAAPAR